MMAHAEYLAGIAFNNASLGYVHSMAHRSEAFITFLTEFATPFSFPMWKCITSRSAPSVLSISQRQLEKKIEGLSPEEAADKSIAAIKKFAADIGIPSGLKDLGAKEEDLELLAENAMRDVCRLTNPRELSKEDIIEIYWKAM
jgi:alcohol dehydrogenase